MEYKQDFFIRDEGIAQNACKFIMGLPMDGTKVVTVTEHIDRRRDAQNRLMWKWLAEIARAEVIQVKIYSGIITLTTPEAVHEYFKAKFLGHTPLQKPKLMALGDGSFFLKEAELGSTTKLGVKRFSEYLNEIEGEVASEYGLVLPHPEDYYYMAMGAR